MNPNTSVYQLEAAIASYYTVAASYEKTNWKVIFKLYDGLVKLKPSPVVKMSRVLVMSKVLGAQKALEAMLEIENETAELQSFQALKAELYAEMGDYESATIHLKNAILQAQNITEKRFLEAKLLNWKTPKSV